MDTPPRLFGQGVYNTVYPEVVPEFKQPVSSGMMPKKNDKHEEKQMFQVQGPNIPVERMNSQRFVFALFFGIICWFAFYFFQPPCLFEPNAAEIGANITTCLCAGVLMAGLFFIYPICGW